MPAGGIVISCGWIGLIEPTETRYGEIAREMLASGDWFIPRLNGIPHFHKPPIAYWSAASGMALFGVNAWGARLGTALAAVVVLWCTARIAAHTREGTPGSNTKSALAPPVAAASAEATLAPILLASAALFFALSHQLSTDMFLAASVAGFYAALFDPRADRSLWPFVALGLGFMAKGPVVLLSTVAPVLAAAWWVRDGTTARRLMSWRGWVVFALIALPWYLAVVFETPGLLSYLLHHQLWQRYTTTIHQRGGPVYYFLAVILIGALPWTWAAVREWWRTTRRARAGRSFEDALLVTWILVPIVFFSFSGSKLPAYVLPVFPALAVLAARGLSQTARGAADSAGFASAAASTAALFLLAAAIEAAAFFVARETPQPVSFWIPVHVATLALAAAGVESSRGAPLRAGSLAFVGLFLALVVAAPLDSKLGSPRALAQTLMKSRLAGEPVVEFGAFNAGVPFYLRETIPMLEVARDLEFDEDETRGRTLIQRPDLVRMVTARGRAWVIGDPSKVDRLANSLGLRASRVAGSGNQSLTLLEQ